MTEEEAKAILCDQYCVSRETFERIEYFVALLTEEMQHQNLISASSLDHIWVRHILDSAQLLSPAIFPDDKKIALQQSPTGKRWLDMGSGAGFPGVIIALMSDWQVTLLESRKRRFEYLDRIIEKLDLDASVAGARAEVFEAQPYSVISARAFAPLPKTLRLAAPFSTMDTQYILPKGRNAQNELLEVAQIWSNSMKIIPSITDPDAGILVGTVEGAS